MLRVLVASLVTVLACAPRTPLLDTSGFEVVSRDLEQDFHAREVILARGHPAPGALLVWVSDSAWHARADLASIRPLAHAALKHDLNSWRPDLVSVVVMAPMPEGANSQSGTFRIWRFRVVGTDSLSIEHVPE
jgi:hypothetical protein